MNEVGLKSKAGMKQKQDAKMQYTTPSALLLPSYTAADMYLPSLPPVCKGTGVSPSPKSQALQGCSGESHHPSPPFRPSWVSARGLLRVGHVAVFPEVRLGPLPFLPCGPQGSFCHWILSH